MNKQRILELADAIERGSPNLGFNMAVYKCPVGDDAYIIDHSGRNCNTVACIVGWADALYNLEGDPGSSLLAKILDIDLCDAVELAMPTGRRWRDITSAQAVRTLRHYAETGEVDWFDAPKKEPRT